MTANASPAVITVDALRKTYGENRAVDDVSFQVYSGEIFGILGPNGAGKTTTLEMIEGLREPDEGRIAVAGFDVRSDAENVKRRIGIQLQSTSLFDHLTVGELVGLFSSLYGSDASPERVDTLLGLVSLQEKRDDLAETLSGGQQQRLSIALALVNDPEIIFLDEPTTGLDPQARRSLWDLVQMIRGQGTTVVLTTHYMEEAEILCDRVAVMDHGQVILCDTASNLIATLETAATLSADFGDHLPDTETLQTIAAVESVRIDGSRVTLQSTDLRQTMAGLLDLSSRNGLEFDNLSTTRPTLEDVFLHYTGRSLRT
jgi:ABC-2 type transport system ATP-binding protein